MDASQQHPQLRPSSLPTDTSLHAPNHGSAKRSPNYIRTQTASPEVISNLIDSLSVISRSAYNHFENLPTASSASASTPATPNIQTHFGHDSLTVPNGSITDFHDDNQLYPDDACEPPVIRTSKPPSGLSPLTAPKKKDKDNSLKSYMSRSAGSLVSVHSVHSVRSISSMGNISIEAGIPRKGSDASNRTSTESKRSSRAHKGLLYMSSRERLRAKDADRKRATKQGPEVLTLPTESVRRPSPQHFVSEDIIKEEPAIAEPSRAAQRYPSNSANPLRNGVNLLGPEGGSPTEKGLIPQRGSSLRHSGSPSRKGRRSHGHKNSRTDSYKTNTVPEEDESVDQETVAKDNILKELEAEENEVAHRIRELKKQKLLRDKIAGKRPVGIDRIDAGASPSLAQVSQIATVELAQLSPTSSVSSTSEKRVQDSAKAHKVLGITMHATPPERRVSRGPETTEIRETRETRKTQGIHLRARSLTVNDGDDITPLPINYKLAMQTLDRAASTSSTPPPSNASSKDTISGGTPPSRSKSIAVGGRSTIGRKPTSSMIMGTSTAYDLSTTTANIANTTNVARASSERLHRSASEDVTPRHHSMAILPSASPPASHSQQNRPAMKKKRWSHPDLPARAEKFHNDKVEVMHGRATPVQSPPCPVIEERPTSIDSIDIDVDGYLNSPRLSQKIRHPQTGRVISFSEVGDPHGFAVFVCVGMGLTRYVMAFYDQLAVSLKLRLITPDRPGVGASQVDPNGTPLSWPDDVLVICQSLKITKFSLLAHSAGAVYALATSLRMPQHIRGRVHLLAPWIPPSQMEPIGISQDQPPTQQLPRSQRFLRALPPSLLKVANSTFLSATSASLQRTGPKNSPKTRRKSVLPQAPAPLPVRPPIKETQRDSIMLMDQVLPNASSLSLAATNPSDPGYERAMKMKEALTIVERERQHEFDERLTFAIWDRATANANPARDLIVCLETKQTIGFRYEDINRAVVIHHGSKDSRVPVDNVRWLGRLMRRCEVRILEGEQHGLMASAQVMGNVLTEMASDWEDWTAIVQGKTMQNGGTDRSISRRRTMEKLRIAT
ncbi:alpha/beta-hydrolase [Pleomassaria siparia CBS 279.74]|uniref:Alpha/beta-hydrolase n=1 Tax=Pleomassaria siparia CBS 279.74 TaxID=1314801 RepID=A0A6G1K8E2_9PLEO|nr:alpha/beta-hydrolase [Pleomassaria siparia CBS 279.74]